MSLEIQVPDVSSKTRGSNVIEFDVLTQASRGLLCSMEKRTFARDGLSSFVASGLGDTIACRRRFD